MGSNDITPERKEQIARARKALKRKIKTVDDEIKQEIAQTQFTKSKKQSRKSKQKTLIIIGGLILLSSLIAWALAPKKGGVPYALCKTFIELRTEYPPELRFTYAETRGKRTRIWYASHDSFGQKQIQKMDCFFALDQVGRIFMEKAEINRGEIDLDEIKIFNASIPAILSNPPDLTLPRGLPEDLKYFQRTTR